MKTREINLNLGSRTIQHSYPVPYERDDEFLKIQSEQDPYSPESAMQPLIGYSLYADANFEYNYYVNKYENNARGVIDYLPSLNMFLLYSNGLIEKKWYDFFFSLYELIQVTPTKILSTQYFSEFGAKYRDALSNSIIYEELKRAKNALKLRNEYISKEMVRIYADTENKREMFPFFAKLKMTGMGNSNYANILEEYGLDSLFANFLINFRSYGSSPQTSIVVYDSETFHTQYVQNGSTNGTFTVNSSNSDYCSVLQNAINHQIGIHKIEKYFEDNIGSDKTEPVAFRIEKYRQETLIDVKYFLNFKDMQEFKLYDTQVDYGEKYVYKIKVINLHFPSDGESPLLLEEPYYEDYFIILDSPPVSPDVNILTYRGVSDKILIMFNQMVDKKVEVPILINPSDESSFLRQWNSQKILNGNPILFESDDPTYFELFRLEEKPHSYEEFVNGKYAVVGSENKTSAGYLDHILPNKTYYYIFRSLDLHGHVSNPTEVFEFRLVKQGETLYPILRISEFKKKDPPTQRSIAFKRFLKIGLVPSQYQVPPTEQMKIDETYVNQDIQLGTSDDNIVSSLSENKPRRFKFRLKSNNTNKLIDINITFKKNKIFIE